MQLFIIAAWIFVYYEGTAARGPSAEMLKLMCSLFKNNSVCLFVALMSFHPLVAFSTLNMSFDSRSFDPMSFDPMSFDPMSFYPMSFDCKFSVNNSNI